MRSIRQDSRLLSHHVMRAVMSALVLYLFFVQVEMARTKSAAGSTFASEVVMCCYYFLTIVGGIHFSSAIAEEKDEDTLALLKMTGASSFSILAGKSLPRLAISILFLFVIAPFLMLSVTLGGVLQLGLVSAMLSMLCYSVMLSQFGLFAGVVSRNSARAFSLTCVLWAVFELGHFFAAPIGNVAIAMLGHTGFSEWWSNGFQSLSAWMSDRSLFVNLIFTLLAYNPEDIWHISMTWHLSIAVVFFLLSWVTFEPCTRRAVSGGDLKPSKRSIVNRADFRGRVWSDAAIWKSWEFTTGGILWFGARLFLGPVVILLGAMVFATASSGRIDIGAIVGFSMFLSICYFLINLARLLGRVYNQEIHDKTLASLVMLPRRTGSILYAMIVGLMPALGAAFASVCMAFLGLLVYATVEGHSDDVFEGFLEPWVWHIFSWITVTAHLGLLLSTWFRYGGMLMSVAICWCGIPMMCLMTIGLMTLGRGPGRTMADILQYVVPVILIMIECVLCLVIQRAIYQRVLTLAGR